MKLTPTKFMVESPLGRMALHLGCLARGGRVRWHLAGIVREFRKGLKALCLR